MTCGAMRAQERLFCSIEPHSAVGGVTPSPRKAREAVVMIAAGISRLVWTMSGERMFGKT